MTTQEYDGYKIRRRAKLSETAKGINVEVTVEMVDDGPFKSPGGPARAEDQRRNLELEVTNTWEKMAGVRDALLAKRPQA
jgi:hypothetical protein